MPTTARSPLVLFLTHTPWLVRSFESVLAPAGFELICASPGDEAQRVFPFVRPDVVLIESDLDEDEALGTCRDLRSDRSLGRCTPIVLVSTREPSRAGRLAALRSGAWDVLAFPADPEEVVLKLTLLAGVRAEVDRMEERGLVDASTGFYNARGLVKRAQELAAESQRHGRPVACVAVAVSAHDSPGLPGERIQQWVSLVGDVIRRVARESDAVGRLRDAEFAILAPGTGGFGARRLAERLAEELRAVVPGAESRLQVHTGCHALEDAPEPAARPPHLVVQAMQSLRKAQMESPAGPVVDPSCVAGAARTVLLG